MVERRLNLVCAAERDSGTALEAGLAKGAKVRIPVLEAQFRRALALSNHDPSQMSARSKSGIASRVPLRCARTQSADCFRRSQISIAADISEGSWLDNASAL